MCRDLKATVNRSRKPQDPSKPGILAGLHTSRVTRPPHEAGAADSNHNRENSASGSLARYREQLSFVCFKHVLNVWTCLSHPWSQAGAPLASGRVCSETHLPGHRSEEKQETQLALGAVSICPPKLSLVFTKYLLAHI